MNHKEVRKRLLVSGL